MTKCINVSQELHDLKDRVETLEKVAGGLAYVQGP